MNAIVAVLNKKGKNAVATATNMLNAMNMENAETIGIASSTTIKIEKNIRNLQPQDVDSHVIIGHVFAKIIESDTPQPKKLEDATMAFDGRIYSPTQQPPNEETIEKKPKQNRTKALKKIIKKTEGDFAFAVAEQERLIAGRDPMGVRPLYYGENKDFAALASTRKALWQTGIEKTSSFPPGHLALVDRKGFQFTPVKTLAYSKPKPITMQAAAEQLQKLLERSVRKRVGDLKEVAIAFSGGLDSSIIALLAKKSKANVQLIHVSLENQPETEWAKRTAEELKLPLHICLFREEDVEKTIQKVVEVIEEPDPVNTSIGIPVYWAAEKAAEMKFKVILAGQGADELFGGYKRYIDDYLQHGKERTQKTIFNDISKLYEDNLERDSKICNYHNIELRVPFITYETAKFAIELPVKLKIEPKKAFRKLVLRRTAKNLGLSPSTAERPKKAIQYSTGTNACLKRVAKKENLPVRDYLNRIFQHIKTANVEIEAKRK